MSKKMKSKVALMSILVAVGLLTVFVVIYVKGHPDTEAAHKSQIEDAQQAGDDAKQAIVDEQNQNEDSNDAAKASITVTDATYYTLQPGALADAVEVRAFVGNANSAGTCKVAVVSEQGTVLEREALAEPDGRNVWCQPVVIPIDRQQFDNESPWKARIDFVSPEAAANTEVNIKTM